MIEFPLDEYAQNLSEFRKNLELFIEINQKTKHPLTISYGENSVVELINTIEYEILVKKIDLLTNIHKVVSQIKHHDNLKHEDAKEQIFEDFI